MKNFRHVFALSAILILTVLTALCLTGCSGYTKRDEIFGLETGFRVAQRQKPPFGYKTDFSIEDLYENWTERYGDDENMTFFIKNGVLFYKYVPTNLYRKKTNTMILYYGGDGHFQESYSYARAGDRTGFEILPQILFPFEFLPDPGLILRIGKYYDYELPQVYLGTRYPLDCDFGALKAFYTDRGLYEITEDGNRLTMRGNREETELSHAEFTLEFGTETRENGVDQAYLVVTSAELLPYRADE